MKSSGHIFSVVFVVGFILFAALFAAPSILQAETNESAVPTAELSSAYQQALLSPLNKAGSEIKDPDIANFFQKIVQEYDLNKTSANSSDEGSAGLANLLPDISKIYKTALNSPLQAAGKQIKDAEIAEFYNSFVARIGVGK